MLAIQYHELGVHNSMLLDSIATVLYNAYLTKAFIMQFY